MIPKQNLSELEELLNSNIQKSYLYFFRKGKIRSVEELYKTSKIKPNYSSEMKEAIQEGYFESFKKGIDWFFRELIESSRTPYSMRRIEKKYPGLFKEKWIWYAKKLYEFTGIKPTEKAIQKGYSELFKRGLISAVQDLYNFTKVKPDYSIDEMKEAIQNGYLKLFKEGSTKSTRELYEFTKISPNHEIERAKPEEWDKIKDKIMEIENKSFKEEYRQTEEDIESTFIDDVSINLKLYVNDNLVGYLISSPIEDYDIEDDHCGKHDTIYLESIAILPEYQKLGLGSKLLEKFEEYAKKEGYSRITLHATNKGMLKTAEKLGFEKDEYVPDWIEGDAWYMEKVIR